jgi:hypothetical protein
MLASLALGQSTAAKPATKKAEAVTLPTGAKKTGEGTWDFTDADGKQWVFKQMPFGLTRMSKADLDARTNTALPDGMSVAPDAAGAYKFTRRTPFGAVTYVKKADDLSETERAVVAAMNRKSATQETAAQQAVKK